MGSGAFRCFFINYDLIFNDNQLHVLEQEMSSDALMEEKHQVYQNIIESFNFLIKTFYLSFFHQPFKRNSLVSFEISFCLLGIRYTSLNSNHP